MNTSQPDEYLPIDWPIPSEHCFLQGRWRFGRWKVSRFGGNDNYLVPQPEDVEKVEALIGQKRRHLERSKKNVDTVVVDTADFQPVSFLQEGAKRCRAVCRISREFSQDEFRDFIEQLQSSADIRAFNSFEKIIDLFSIPKQLAYDEIFTLENTLDIKEEPDPSLNVENDNAENKWTRIIKEAIFRKLKRLKIKLTSEDKEEISRRIKARILFVENWRNAPNSKEIISENSLKDFLKEDFLRNLIEDLIKDSKAADAFSGLVGLSALKKINTSILAKLNPLPVGTGFLVGGNHLLTNQHVIPDPETAAQCIAQFGYVQDVRGVTQTSIDYGINPRDLFVSNADLDYTLVQLEAGHFTKQAGYEFGWIEMVENEDAAVPGYLSISEDLLSIKAFQRELEQFLRNKIDKVIGDVPHAKRHKVLEELDDIKVTLDDVGVSGANKKDVLIHHPYLTLKDIKLLLSDLNDSESSSKPAVELIPGDRVFIIQHPRGAEQQIVLSDNNIIPNGLYRNFLRYIADSDYGSSGSPVFNEHWQLIALHHAAIGEIAIEDIATTTQSFNTLGTTDSSDQFKATEPNIYAQQGVRICRVVADLKEKSLSLPKLRSFIEDFVITGEQIKYPPLPSGLEFNGLNSYVSVDGEAALSFVGTSHSGETIFSQWSKGGLPLTQFEWPSIPGQGDSAQIWLSPDGQMLARAVEDNEIELRKSTGEVLVTLSGHTGPITSVSFGPKNTLIASGSKDNTIKLWYGSDQQYQIFHTENIGQPVLSVHLANDNKTQDYLLVATTDDRKIHRWDVKVNASTKTNGTLLIKPKPKFESQHPISKLLVGPKGQIVTINAIGQPEIWTKTGEPLILSKSASTEAIHSEDIFFLTFSPDGKTLASASETDLKLWKHEDDWSPTTLKDVGELSSKVTPRFTSDNKLLLVIDMQGNQKSLKIWNIKDNRLEETKDIGNNNEDVFFSPDGQILASASETDLKLWKRQDNWNPTTLKDVDSKSVGKLNRKFPPRFSSDNKFIVAIDIKEDQNRLIIWNINDKRPKIIDGNNADIFKDIFKDNIFFLAFSPDGKSLASASETDLKLWKHEDDWSPTTLKNVGELSRKVTPRFSPDSKSIFAVDIENNQKIGKTWNLKGEVLKKEFLSPDKHEDENADLLNADRLTGTPEALKRVAFSPRGEKKPVSIQDEGVSIRLNLQERGAPIEIKEGKSQLRAIANGGKPKLSAIAKDGMILLNDYKGARKKVLRNIFQQVINSADGRYLFLTSKDGTIQKLSWEAIAPIGQDAQPPKLVESDAEDSSAESFALDTISVSEKVNQYDGLMIVTANVDGSLRIFRQQSKQGTLANLNTFSLPQMPGQYRSGYLKLNPQHSNLQYEEDPYSFDESKKSFCLEAWVHPSSDGAGGTIISKWKGGKDGEYSLKLLANGTVVFSQLGMSDGTNVSVYELKSSSKLPMSQFSHVAATFAVDGARQYMRLYINGKSTYAQPISQGHFVPLFEFEHVYPVSQILWQGKTFKTKASKLELSNRNEWRAVGQTNEWYVDSQQQGAKNREPDRFKWHDQQHDDFYGFYNNRNNSKRDNNNSYYGDYDESAKLANDYLKRKGYSCKEFILSKSPDSWWQLSLENEKLILRANNFEARNYLKKKGYSSYKEFILPTESLDYRLQLSLQDELLILQAMADNDINTEGFLDKKRPIIIFSPDSQWLAFAIQSTLIVWNFTQPIAPPFILDKHDDTIIDLAFSPDGRYLASAAEDHIAKVWDLKVLKFELGSGAGNHEPSYIVDKVVQQNDQIVVWLHDSIEVKNRKQDTATPVLIGASFSGMGDVNSSQDILTDFFKGRIAEVRIWDTARSAEEIQRNLYRRLQGNEENLIGYWRLEEGTGDRVKNLAAQKNSLSRIPSYGKALNAKWLNAMQFPTIAMPFSRQFNGKDDYVDCGDVDQINNAITVESWVKHNSGDGLIVHLGEDFDKSGYALFWHRGKIRVELKDKYTPDNTLIIDTQENAPTDHAWHHIAFTWTEELDSKTSQEVEIYIDGRRQNVIAIKGESRSTLLSGGLYKTVGIFKGQIGDHGLPLTIGAAMAKKDFGGKPKLLNHFDGEITEVRLWNLARTQNQIKANLYYRLDQSEEDNLIGYWRLDGDQMPETIRESIGRKQPFCLEAWLHPSPDGARDTIVSSWKGGNDDEYSLKLLLNGTVISSQLEVSGTVYELKSSSKLPMNQFSHVAATFTVDGARPYMRLYIKPTTYAQPISQGHFVPLFEFKDVCPVRRILWEGKTFKTRVSEIIGEEWSEDQLFVTIHGWTNEWDLESTQQDTKDRSPDDFNLDGPHRILENQAKDHLKENGYSHKEFSLPIESFNQWWQLSLENKKLVLRANNDKSRDYLQENGFSHKEFMLPIESLNYRLQLFLQDEQLILQATVKNDNNIEHFVDEERPVITFSPDSQWLAFSIQSTLIVWNFTQLTAPPFVLGKHDGNIIDLTFSPDSRYLASAAEDHIAKVWDLNALIFEIVSDSRTDNHKQFYIVDKAVEQNGPIIVWLNFSQKHLVTLYEFKHVYPVRRILWEGKTFKTKVSKITRKKTSEDQVYVKIHGRTNEWHLESQQQGTKDRSPDDFNWDGPHWIRKDQATDYQKENGYSHREFSLPLESLNQWWQLSLENKKLVLRANNDKSRDYLQETGYSNKEFMLSIESLDYRLQIFLQDEQLILQAMADNDNNIEHFVDEERPVIVFSPDSQWLAFSIQSTLIVWNFTQPTAPPFILGKHDDTIIDLAFSPDGRYLASAAEDHIAKVWDFKALIHRQCYIVDKVVQQNDQAIVWLDDSIEAPAQFEGRVAEVRLWDTARSVEEIQWDLSRQLQGDEDHLIGYWRLEEGIGDVNANLATSKNINPSLIISSEPTDTDSGDTQPDDESKHWASEHWTANFIAGLQNQDIAFFKTVSTKKLDATITLQQFFDIYQQVFKPRSPLTTSLSMDIPITRFAAILLVTKGLGFTDRDQDIVDQALDMAQVYADLDQIAEKNHRYIPTLATATLRKLVVNYPKKYQLRPNAPITQAEFATLIYQALVAKGEAAPIESEYIVAPTISNESEPIVDPTIPICPQGATSVAEVNANLLAGTWNYQNQPGPVISNDATSIDMSAYGSPPATISGLDNPPIAVVFSADYTFEFTFCNGNGKNYLAWSNGTVWERNQFVGIWIDQGNYALIISVSGNIITIDMSDYGRLNATGVFKDDNTIEVIFPDVPGRHFKGELVDGSIQWSNNTVWTR